MQELRLVAVSEDGSYAVLVVPGRGGRYSLQIDDRLRAVARGQFSRLAQYEIEVESPLRPKEIQERIRAGETADEIADAAGVPIERVRWFEGPVLAERAYKAQEAQSAMVRRPGDSGPGPTLGEVVTERLTALGTSAEDAHWDSVKRSDGTWQVQLLFSAAGRAKTAEWVYDPRRRHATPDGDEAARLSLPEADLPPDEPGGRGEATVTPLQPRFGSAAGQAWAPPGGPVPRPPRRAAEAAPARPGSAPPRPRPQPANGSPPAPPVSEPRTSQPAHAGQAARPEPEAGRPVPAAGAARLDSETDGGPAREQAPAQAERAATVRGSRRRAAQGQQEAPRQQEPRRERAAQAQQEPRRQEAAQAQQQQQPPAAEEPAEAAASAAAQRAPAGQGGRRTARGRRSSVPSWDEIMFGSSRPRD
jgi:hypothetical protein